MVASPPRILPAKSRSLRPMFYIPFMKTTIILLLILIMPLSLAQQLLTSPPASTQSVGWFSYSVDYERKDDEPQGMLFEFRGDGFRCAAGFVYSIQSRVTTNQNDLEFWCRQDRVTLSFSKLPKPSDSVTSVVINVDGRLHETISHRFYDFEKSEWKAARPFFLTNKSGGQRYYFVSGECDGLSLYRGNDYLGTVRGNYSAALVIKGRVIVNIDNGILSGPIPEKAELCSPLALTQEKGSGWLYAFYPAISGIVFGSSYGGYNSDNRGCAKMFHLDGREVSYPCKGGRVKEFYSYTPFYNGVLVGNFPLGTLLYLNGNSLRETDFAAPDDLDWRDPRGTYYRESQSLVLAYGAVMIGMYPWSEFTFVDTRTRIERKTRLIQQPVKSHIPTPYFEKMEQQAKALPGVVSSPKQERVYSLTINGKTLRDDGYEPTHWGQRIPSIAILSGKVCASTGNLGGAPRDPKKHGFVPEKVADLYGSVYCADLPGHVMANIPRSGKLAFHIGDYSLSIIVDGKIIVQAKHGLARRQLEQIRSGRYSNRFIRLSDY